MKRLKVIGLKVFPYIKNHFILATFAFVVWMMFFDKNSVLDQVSIYSKLKKIEDNKAYHQEEIAKNQENLNQLKTNRKTLEKFAREKYLMKKDDEDVFVFVKAPKKE